MLCPYLIWEVIVENDKTVKVSDDKVDDVTDALRQIKLDGKVEVPVDVPVKDILLRKSDFTVCPVCEKILATEPILGVL